MVLALARIGEHLFRIFLAVGSKRVVIQAFLQCITSVSGANGEIQPFFFRIRQHGKIRIVGFPLHLQILIGGKRAVDIHHVRRVVVPGYGVLFIHQNEKIPVILRPHIGAGRCLRSGCFVRIF